MLFLWVGQSLTVRVARHQVEVVAPVDWLHWLFDTVGKADELKASCPARSKASALPLRLT